MRSKIDDADIIELVDKFCRSKIEEGVLDNEIKRRTNGGAPYTIENLSFASDGGQLRDDKIVEKINWKSIGKKYSSTYKKTIKHV